jgi:Ca2+:H+ antiporter
MEGGRSGNMTSSGQNGDAYTDEHTRLLGGDASTDDADARPKSAFYEWFLNKRQTPGIDSNNIFVRWPARGFNITKVTLLSNYINILLPFILLGIIAKASSWDPPIVSILNFFAIIPLVAVLLFITEKILIKLGEILGGLLNTTFGNTIELIIGIEMALYITPLIYTI